MVEHILLISLQTTNVVYGSKFKYELVNSIPHFEKLAGILGTPLNPWGTIL